MISDRKNILLICQVLPAKSGSGVAMRLYNWARALSKHNELTILLVSQDAQAAVGGVDGINARLIVHDNQRHNNDSERVKVSVLPEMHRRWDANKLLLNLDCFHSQHFDTVVVSRLRLAPVWSLLKDRLLVSTKRAIIDFDDIESLAALRRLISEREGLSWRQLIWGVREAAKLYIAELRAIRLFDRVVVCSNTDTRKLARIWLTSKGASIPNCVEEVEFSDLPSNPRNPNILFVGTLNYSPNIQGIKWFVNEVWDRVCNVLREKGFEPTLSIVGKNPTPWLANLEPSKSIAVYGNVESVTPFYEAATIVICPIFQGGGTRIKILEAFAHSRAVVSTTLGAEGIDAIDGDHIVLANTSLDFIASIVCLVEDEPRLAIMRRRAFALFIEKYSTHSFDDHVLGLIG